MTIEDKLYTIALTKLGYISSDNLLRIIQETGGGRQVFMQRNDISDIIPGCTQRLKELIP